MKTSSGLLEAFGSIRLMGETLVPSEIDAFMQARPTLSYRRGDSYVSKTTKDVKKRRFGLWLLSTRGMLDSHDLRDHERRIESMIRSRTDFAAFIEAHDLNLSVSLYWHGPAEAALPQPSEGLRTTVADAGGEFETDFATDSQPAQHSRVA